MVLAEICTGIQYVIGAGMAQARDWTSEETWFIFQHEKVFVCPQEC